MCVFGLVWFCWQEVTRADLAHFTAHLIERGLSRTHTAGEADSKRNIEHKWKVVESAFLLNDELRNLELLKNVRLTAKWGFVPTDLTVQVLREQFGDSVGMHVMKS